MKAASLRTGTMTERKGQAAEGVFPVTARNCPRAPVMPVRFLLPFLKPVPVRSLAPGGAAVVSPGLTPRANDGRPPPPQPPRGGADFRGRARPRPLAGEAPLGAAR